MELFIAGGVGEHGRNCFYVQGERRLLSGGLRENGGHAGGSVSPPDAGADSVRWTLCF